MPQLPVPLPTLAAALMLLAPLSGPVPGIGSRPAAAAEKSEAGAPNQAVPHQAPRKPAARHAPAKTAEPQFVAGIGDLPLMPGLSPVPEQEVVFDKPTGRIVQAVARGRVDPAEISRFYAETVAQLGWRATGGGTARTLGRFEREGEVLELERLAVPGQTGQVTVRFTLMPR